MKSFRPFSVGHRGQRLCGYERAPPIRGSRFRGF